MAKTGPRVGFRGTPQERLERRLERRPSGCLEWTGAVAGRGYGVIKVSGRMVYVHRLAWSLVNGDIPHGEIIRHFVCDNPPCCEPTHLRPGTPAQNTADMLSKNRGRWRTSERQ